MGAELLGLGTLKGSAQFSQGSCVTLFSQVLGTCLQCGDKVMCPSRRGRPALAYIKYHSKLISSYMHFLCCKVRTSVRTAV